MIVSDNRIIFINTLGDVSAIDISSGNLLWQTPTQSSAIYENSFSLKNLLANGILPYDIINFTSLFDIIDFILIYHLK